MSDERPDLPEAARAALARGRAIEAIKIVREAHGLSLKDAKTLVDAHRRQGRSLPIGHAGAPDVRGKGLGVILLVGVLFALWWLLR